jgi:hypothetical protein
LDFSVSRIAKTSIVETSPMSRTWNQPEEPSTPPLAGEAMASSSSYPGHPQVKSPCPPTNRELYAIVMDLKATNRELYAMVMDMKVGLKENKSYILIQ